jgi:hypothetical protein
VPLSRLSGATPTSAAICLFVKIPNSGKFSSTVVVSTGQTPGTAQQVVFLSPDRTVLDRLREIRVGMGPLSLEPGNMRAEALAN